VHGALEVRVAPQMVLSLLQRHYATHVRELEAILWRGIAASRGDTLALAPEDEKGARASAPVTSNLADDASELSPAHVQACLDANNGAIEETWRALGLSSRHVLARYIKRHALLIRRHPSS
jgi:transcriptional regulator with GAF, ATPase, and Fis domain